MLERLLESRVRRERSLTGTATSVVAHSALIGAAVFATARARPRIEKPETPDVRAIYFAPLPAPHSVSTHPASAHPPPVHAWVFVDPVVKVNVPVIDVVPGLSAPVTEPRGGSPFNGSAVRVAGGMPAGDTFTSEQVERQVSLEAGSQPPRYPESLRSAGIEGTLTARFVVNVNGRVDPDSVVFVRSGNSLFEAAVRSSLARMRFVPAEVGGRKVRQLVEMPFVFTLNK
jgi:protein TonB